MKTTAFILFIIIFTSQGIYCQSDFTFDAGTDLVLQTGANLCADAVIINGSWSGGGTICDGPMPVLLSTFNASIDRNNVRLVWATVSEINNSGFDIERKSSKDGSAWQKLSFIPGNGSTNVPKIYTVEDKKIAAGKYNYRLKQIDYNGNFEYFPLAIEISIDPPLNFSMSQNYPNPSNPKSKIDYEVPVDGKVTIKVFDIIGREVATLVNETKVAGYYTTELDGTNLASGVYFYKISAGSYVMTKRMVLVK